MQFFKHFNQLMLIVFSLILIVAFGLFYLQYNTQYQYTVNGVKTSFQERVLRLEVLRAAKDQVESMKLSAETYWTTHPAPPPSVLFSQLQSAENTFNLDKIEPPYSPKTVGNLTGIGTLQHRDSNFYREVEMALALNSSAQVAKYSIPNAVWVYYTSANHFMNIYPWVASQDFSFNDDSFQHEFYYLGLPENNPQRQTFWTAAYVDLAGKGMMVTCGAPVYDQDRFLGTVALDFTVDILSRFVQNFRSTSENLFIINDKNQLLAHSYLVNAEDQSIKTAEIAFPKDLQNNWQNLLQATEGEFIDSNGYLVIYRKLSYMPWKLVFWVSKQEIQKEVFYKVGWGIMILLFSLISMLLMTYQITRQEFIRPANQLVEHIESENAGLNQPIPNVPNQWHTWFVTISRTFAENRRLFAELKNYSTELEQKVEERTQQISERNQQLLFKNKQLEELNREKNEFLGIVAHDLKNPLSGFLGLADLMLEMDGDIPQEELLNHARLLQTGSSNMFQLITNLLDVNAIESGKINIHLQHIKLQPLLAEIVQNYTERAHRKNIEIHFETQSDSHILTDAQIARQILDNLISNAIKYSPLGKNIYIRLYETAADVCCEIQDQGLGLSAADQQKLFSKFTRLATKPTGDEHSTGLGLFIVKKLADAIAVQVRCDSELGRGATFTAMFPKKLST